MEEAPTNELTVVAQSSGLEPTKIESLLANFGSSYAQAKELVTGASDLVVTDESDTATMQAARAKRLALKNVRVEVENTRKSLKEQSLREGKAIDGISNIIKALIVPVEEHLEAQEKFAEIKATERKAARHAHRIEELSQYVPDVSLYSLDDMTDETFNALVASSKEAHEAQLAAQAKAEAERVAKEKADAEEQDRIREENIKLKEEAAAREAVLEEERKAREAAEMVENDRKAAEAAKEAQAAEEARKALHAPDREKLIKLADEIEAIAEPIVGDASTFLIVKEAMNSLQTVAATVRTKAEGL